MSLGDNDGSEPPLRVSPDSYPYNSSLASSASSSTSSLFSAEVQSSQSSAYSSAKSAPLQCEAQGHLGAIGEEADDSQPPCHIPAAAVACARHPSRDYNQTIATQTQAATTTGAVPPELRVHPRRTQSNGSDCGASGPRPPPSLVRQCERKDNFVESLVDTTTQMIEVIWPLSVIPSSRDAVLGGKNLISLRTFIQEVLKRSKTSYSTLQVALYYLVLIKPRIPTVDFTKEQPEDSHASRAMQCGRRMFLAALILASKYLQDRNYSARAWSKISGLNVAEINLNEMAFVKAVDWKLHIPEPRFQRWTDVVLKFSLTVQSASATNAANEWRRVIPRLTPELDEMELGNLAEMKISEAPNARQPRSMSPPGDILERCAKPLSPSLEMPPPLMRPPTTIEPSPMSAKENFQFPPFQPRITQLPTPQLTPRTTFGTPAVGAGAACLRQASMRMAMRKIQNCSMMRSAMDSWPPHSALASRRSSLSSSNYSSSPESTFSGRATRSSRSSSVSSIASMSTLATASTGSVESEASNSDCPGQEANPPHNGAGSDYCAPWLEPYSSTQAFPGLVRESYVRGSAPICDQGPALPIAIKTGGSLGADPQTLAAKTPCGSNLRADHNYNNTNPEDNATIATSDDPGLSANRRIRRTPTAGSKRERPTSISSPLQLHENVRHLLAATGCLPDEAQQPPIPSECAPRTAYDGDDRTVLPDSHEAKTFLLKAGFRLEDLCPGSASMLADAQHARSASGSRGGQRKRQCIYDICSGSESSCGEELSWRPWHAIA